jgi:hypothetical protein
VSSDTHKQQGNISLGGPIFRVKDNFGNACLRRCRNVCTLVLGHLRLLSPGFDSRFFMLALANFRFMATCGGPYPGSLAIVRGARARDPTIIGRHRYARCTGFVRKWSTLYSEANLKSTQCACFRFTTEFYPTFECKVDTLSTV